MRDDEIYREMIILQVKIRKKIEHFYDLNTNYQERRKFINYTTLSYSMSKTSDQILFYIFLTYSLLFSKIKKYKNTQIYK